MGKSKVSIIVPVYNTEEYVEEAILSILQQSLQDIEVIVINDGSTDRSQQIIENLSSNDSRIKLFSQANHGQSVARNKGIDIASGEYIYFMDSDDILREDALEQCYTKSKAENLDIVFFDADIFGDNGDIFNNNYYKRTNELEERVYSGTEMLNTLIDRNKYRVSMCLNFIRRDYLMDIQLRLYPGIIHEDEIFTTLLYVQAQRISFLKEAFFQRRVRGNSTMTSTIGKRNVEGYFTAAAILKQFARKSIKEQRKCVEKYLNKMLNAAIRKFHKLPFLQKIKIKITYCIHYTKYVNIKTLLILFLK